MIEASNLESSVVLLDNPKQRNENRTLRVSPLHEFSLTDSISQFYSIQAITIACRIISLYKNFPRTNTK